MADKPSILLLFANPKGDLEAIKGEMNAITKILRLAKLQKKIDFDSYENEQFDEIIKYTPNASIFHFSGHANQQQLLLTKDASSADAICDLLKLSKTKLLFLNGCSTKAFLEKVFTRTEVIAAIATNNKVKDEVAAELSIKFYDRLMWGDDLDTVFRKMRSSFEQRAKILHWDGCYMRDLELPESSFPDENINAFQWGLFYKEKNYGKITIGNLLEKGETAQDEIDRKIKALKDELEKALKILNDLEKVRSTGALQELYLTQQNAVTELKSKLKEQEDARATLIKDKSKLEEDAKNRKIKEEFCTAIKNLNYTRQRDIYKKGTSDCQFACYAAAGDEDALIDLLLIRLEEDYGFLDNNHTPITIDYASAGSQELWPALADKLHIDKQETPEKIAGVLINDLFLGNRSYSQQHIFLKIYITQVPIEKIEELVCDFWTNVQKACNQSGAFTNKENIRHKIVVMLIDEISTNERHEQIKAITKENARLMKTGLEPMPWIEPLNQDKIESWIDSHTLDRVGLQSAMANDIYTESNNGKIRKVLKSVQKRCTVPDLDLFHKLNILPDDAQTLLGQIGK